jgi:hypothetical protein
LKQQCTPCFGIVLSFTCTRSNAIAWAIRLDGPGQLKERLAGLRWQWIPYAASGILLAREIEKAVAGAPETDVFILAKVESAYRQGSFLLRRHLK